MSDERAFGYDRVYRLDEIQAQDPNCDRCHHPIGGDVLYATVGQCEYVFYPEEDGWKLNHIWVQYPLRHKERWGLEQPE